MKYIIKKNRHYSSFNIGRLFPFTGNRIAGTFNFSEECLVQGEVSGHNKLTGISSFRIHNNSGRIVWQSDGINIKVWGYVYKDGVRKEQYITSVNVNTLNRYVVSYRNGAWLFSVNDKTVVLSGKLGLWKTRAYFYFGGQSTAPITMSVNIT